MKEEIDKIIKEWAVKAGKRKVITPKYIRRTLLGSFHDIDLCVAIEIASFIEIDHYTYDAGAYAIGGAYVPDVGFDFELKISFSAHDIENGFESNQKWVDDFALELAQVSIHENKHREQAEARDNMPVYAEYRVAANRTQEYLGNYDEIDAYGLSIAYQLSERFGDEALHMLQFEGVQQITDLCEYTKAFNKGHIVLKRLFKKIATHLINEGT